MKAILGHSMNTYAVDSPQVCQAFPRPPHTTPGSSNSTPTKVVVVDIGGCGQW